ncbi:PREDICTED: uncharacterized protein LOC106147246 isoform X3 [Chinchilla lanigera]|uniref:uncharacterized protein LOC106147246 isoform X3 n=1 Tax=Chinchilla lanigera TaxID=34839 RepID=UPI00069724EA|nr:PREDICTED: uncharacterized protein LOC106147246 isoform X3 [Chinchilla lanigera]XP_013363128.1 PREDICTED: uncharacterized protein LOC106147246 isoform X3 [Chinchilla lanigera]
MIASRTPHPQTEAESRAAQRLRGDQTAGPPQSRPRGAPQPDGGPGSARASPSSDIVLTAEEPSGTQRQAFSIRKAQCLTTPFTTFLPSASSSSPQEVFSCRNVEFLASPPFLMGENITVFS